MAHNYKGVAVITGSAQGIGRAIALRLADDGFDIALNDLPFQQTGLDEISTEITKKGRKSFVFTSDASVEAEVKALIDAVVSNLGGIDVMVANAGICLIKPLLETTSEDWDRLFSINVRGVLFAYQHAARAMIQQGRGGRLIGACSGAGKHGQACMSAYSAAKFALRGLSESAALEFGKYGITVNTYAPGAIKTSMLNAVGDAFGDRQTIFEAEAQRLPVGYIGKPEDVAALVSYLASKESHYVTGQSVSINGGRECD